MGLSIVTIKKMIEAGLSDEDIQAYLDGWSKCLDCEERRYKDRTRKIRGNSEAKKGLPHTPSKEGLSLENNIRAIHGNSAERFNEFWSAYPKRDGPNPKKPAQLKFIALAKRGENVDAIIAAAKLYAHTMAASEPKFIAMAQTWLNQERWNDLESTATDEERYKAAVLAFRNGHKLQ